jgi:hypothetical protein
VRHSHNAYSLSFSKTALLSSGMKDSKFFAVSFSPSSGMDFGSMSKVATA